MEVLYLAELLHACKIKPTAVMPFNPAKDRLVEMNFTASNTSLHPTILEDTGLFSQYVLSVLNKAGARYGIGGYNEHRTIYARSGLFDSTIATEEPRRLHLGVDIWGPALTPVMSPLPGKVHSWGIHNERGNYGAVVILQHQLGELEFYTLYGHLSTASAENKFVGQPVAAGEIIGVLGLPAENGDWPPHLHFQIIQDMQGYKGDYPGVCRFSEREKWLLNCPDPAPLLNPLLL
jgi:murein DD-endopeptidase MepM/ murein hydrolase activator NlpD